MLSDRSIEAALRSAAHPGPASALPHERFADEPSGPCVAISREVGARGTTVARLVGAKLDWPVYGRELVELVARDMNVRATQLSEVDEKPSSWLEECIRALGGISQISESAFCHRLVKVLWSLAQRGQCIIVGRGAAQVLPAATTLRVRLIGNIEDRIGFVARQRGLSLEIAGRQVAAIDRDLDCVRSRSFSHGPDRRQSVRPGAQFVSNSRPTLCRVDRSNNPRAGR